ncbi:hypothetical protein AVHM3334_10855 [Acidovorax sp. SUPP3334]|nr:hypothetical protein AVHM3334_10855 [Acidovorax sp. SUPP3334]
MALRLLIMALSVRVMLKLLGVSVAPDLRGQPWSHAVVVLAQLQAVLLGHLHQVLAALVQQPAVGRVGDGLGHVCGCEGFGPMESPEEFARKQR